jgi:hypothetical protein
MGFRAGLRGEGGSLAGWPGNSGSILRIGIFETGRLVARLRLCAEWLGFCGCQKSQRWLAAGVFEELARGPTRPLSRIALDAMPNYGRDHRQPNSARSTSRL